MNLSPLKRFPETTGNHRKPTPPVLRLSNFFVSSSNSMASSSPTKAWRLEGFEAAWRSMDLLKSSSHKGGENPYVQIILMAFYGVLDPPDDASWGVLASQQVNDMSFVSSEFWVRHVFFTPMNFCNKTQNKAILMKNTENVHSLCIGLIPPNRK